MKTGNIKEVYFCILVLFAFDVLFCNAQDETIEHYEITGAKIGRKIGRQVVQSYIERTPAVNTARSVVGLGYKERSGYHRPLSFVGAMDGVTMGSLAQSYTYQNYYHGPRGFNYRKKTTNSSDISNLEIDNITFADDDDDGMISKDEVAQIYFDLINTGDTPLYGITPVILANKTKHLIISDPVAIDTLEAQSALRYVIEVAGDGKRDPGNAYILLRIKYGQQQFRDIQEIKLGTKRRSDSE